MPPWGSVTSLGSVTTYDYDYSEASGPSGAGGPMSQAALAPPH